MSQNSQHDLGQVLGLILGRQKKSLLNCTPAWCVLRLGDPEELRDELALGRAVLPLGLGPDQVALRVPAQTWVALLALRTPISESTLSCRVTHQAGNRVG